MEENRTPQKSFYEFDGGVRDVIEKNMQSAAMIRLCQNTLLRGGNLKLKVFDSDMEPTFKIGDIVTIKPVKINEFNVGDIVFYITDNQKLVAHRIMKKMKWGTETIFITKADTKEENDPPVRPSQVMGKAIEVKREGTVISLESSIKEESIKKIKSFFGSFFNT
ncbi:MAG: signal peptidase I [Firmicutes bacterium]|nr:signal peptidase I [Bacillota bacterium]